MKSTNDNNGSNSHNNNWLGFSLSPYMKMEVSSNPHHQYNHHHHQPKQVLPSGFSLSPSSHLNSSAMCYGVGENVGFHSPLSVMPLKSDGSLCIMEALSRSQPPPPPQGMVPNSSPKLEDFLGGATMAAHHQYSTNEREAMALSLDSMYYHHQNADQQTNRHHWRSREKKKPGRPNLQTDNTQITACLKNWIVVEDSGGACGSGGGPVGGCGDLQSLSLSMSPGSQSSCVTAPTQISPTGTESTVMETKKRGSAKVALKQPVHRKSIDTFGWRTSQYRGVTRSVRAYFCDLFPFPTSYVFVLMIGILRSGLFVFLLYNQMANTAAGILKVEGDFAGPDMAPCGDENDDVHRLK
ncbi:AP2-like ethylene-responsive transcription factor ANT [Camellia sinensis]|uniref:AP2-like ethylene-responsive transcription factor ANT n=1 Tax=Camellia sinensis TaxID=4442 RepID=UPI001035836E|nr:AP2-like ethylene-responsive transcription factor ANT [Camellia sinensis]